MHRKKFCIYHPVTVQLYMEIRNERDFMSERPIRCRLDLAVALLRSRYKATRSTSGTIPAHYVCGNLKHMIGAPIAQENTVTCSPQLKPILLHASSSHLLILAPVLQIVER